MSRKPRWTRFTRQERPPSTSPHTGRPQGTLLAKILIVVARVGLPVSMLVSTVLIAGYVFPPPSPPDAYPVSSSLLFVHGDVVGLQHWVSGPLEGMDVTVVPGTLTLEVSGNNGATMVANMEFGLYYESEDCWKGEMGKGSSGPTFFATRIDGSDCEDPTELGMVINGAQARQADPLLYLRYPERNIHVFYDDPANIPPVENFLVGRYSFDGYNDRMPFKFPGHDWRLDRSGIVARAANCSATDLSSEPSNWLCSFNAVQDGPHTITVDTLPMYLDFSWATYHRERELYLIALGVLAGLLGGAIYAELDRLTRSIRIRPR